MKKTFFASYYNENYEITSQFIFSETEGTKNEIEEQIASFEQFPLVLLAEDVKYKLYKAIGYENDENDENPLNLFMLVREEDALQVGSRITLENDERYTVCYQKVEKEKIRYVLLHEDTKEIVGSFSYLFDIILYGATTINLKDLRDIKIKHIEKPTKKRKKKKKKELLWNTKPSLLTYNEEFLDYELNDFQTDMTLLAQLENETMTLFLETYGRKENHKHLHIAILDKTEGSLSFSEPIYTVPTSEEEVLSLFKQHTHAD